MPDPRVSPWADLHRPFRAHIPNSVSYRNVPDLLEANPGGYRHETEALGKNIRHHPPGASRRGRGGCSQPTAVVGCRWAIASMATPRQPAAAIPAVRIRPFPGKGVALAGWQCHAPGERRGTLVYLHGVADNRAAVAGIVSRFTAQGFDVVAYDSRAHGNSQGDACTYGFYEKEDLRSVLDTLDPGPIVLIGTSLGAAVALQEAADDSRVYSSRGRRGIFRSSYRCQGARPLFPDRRSHPQGHQPRRSARAVRSGSSQSG